MHHKADKNEFLSAFSGSTLTTSCIKKNSNAMNDVLMNEK